jgi:medium-chain acyl-[acyl-carrier-protein] hydrolase
VPASDDAARWLRRPAGAEAARVRLLCFHHAGGAASMFRRWPRLVPHSIEPIAVELPGRGARFTQPPFDRMAPLVEALVEVVTPLLDRPYACYGMSMGARVAWALTHRLRERGMPPPVALYLASASAPDAGYGRCDWKHDLLGYLREMGGTPPEILAEPGLLDSVLPTLLADLTLVDTFRLWRPATPLDVPILAFAGADDVDASPLRMGGWRAETTGEFRLEVRPGGHFFDDAYERRLVRTIAGDLLTARMSHELGERVRQPDP